MGQSYFASPRERAEYNATIRANAAESLKRQGEEAVRKAAEIEANRMELAAKIVMAAIDKIVNEVVRPGPKPEERECYEMAGEMRALVPDLEALAKAIIDENKGCP